MLAPTVGDHPPSVGSESWPGRHTGNVCGDAAEFGQFRATHGGGHRDLAAWRER